MSLIEQLPTPLSMSAQLIPATPDAEEHIHIDMIFELIADAEAPPQVAEGEVSSVRWLTHGEILNHDLATFDAVRAFAAARLIEASTNP